MMTVQEALENILKAVFGKDVRQSIHDGIKIANDKVDEYTAKQDTLETKYDNLLDEMSKSDPSLAEVVDARTNAGGTSFGTLKARLDDSDSVLNELDSDLDGLIESFLNKAYPVGIVVPFANAFDPNTLGGTWERFANGRTLVGVDENDTNFNSVKKTGGSSTVTLNTNQLPSHYHTENDQLYAYSTSANYVKQGTSTTEQFRMNTTYKIGKDKFKTESSGGNQAHTNLQPYTTVFYWVRIK